MPTSARTSSTSVRVPGRVVRCQHVPTRQHRSSSRMRARSLSLFLGSGLPVWEDVYRGEQRTNYAILLGYPVGPTWPRRSTRAFRFGRLAAGLSHTSVSRAAANASGFPLLDPVPQSGCATDGAYFNPTLIATFHRPARALRRARHAEEVGGAPNVHTRFSGVAI
jgi:hypothetical protein